MTSRATGGCSHCGLAAREGDLYCCYGCELAAQIAKEGAEEHGKTKAALLVSLLLSMTVMMLSLFLFSEDVYDIQEGAALSWLATAYRVASGVLSTPVILLLGVPVAKRALISLRKGRLSMDLLVFLGAFAAYGISVYSILAGRRGVYFDSATSALLLSTLGRYLEARGRAKASSLLGPSLRRSSEPVLVKRDGEFTSISPTQVNVGDVLRIDTEEVLPVDARLIAGPVEVNLGVLTGESVPVVKQSGEELPAGAVIIAGPIEVEAVRPLSDSTLERLGDLAKKLASRPTSLQRWADRFAAALTPIVAIAAFATLGVHAHRATAEEGVIAALAVVLAACPCTYGVATPLVFWLALRKALSHGVLIRNAAVLEELKDVRAVAFDKTGTLTDRALCVANLRTAPEVSENDVWSLVAALEEGTKHPVGRALAEHASRLGVEKVALTSRKPIAGKGISATLANGETVLLGSAGWLAEQGIVESGQGANHARARVILAREKAILAHIDVGESLVPEAAEALLALKAQGITAFMLTGDGSYGAEQAAEQLGIEAYSGLSAEDKVRALEAAGGGVAMVGDGQNDAPALAGTRPSFAVHGGTDLARGMAQISLLTPDLKLVPWTIALSKRAFSIARSNLIWSTVYNLLFLTLATTGLLRPVWAGISMATSSLLMLASASRVRLFESPDGQVPRDVDEDEVPADIRAMQKEVREQAEKKRMSASLANMETPVKLVREAP
ncbi:MAG: cation-translocating P-type ATPase [Polyangiaceae bacterium]|nr:cation-translocating P-type ATPase [Polyangiaceae bacterium]